MALLQSIKPACGARVGADGIAPAAFEKALAGTADALVQLRARHTDRTLPLLRLPQRRDDLDEIVAVAERLCAEASDLVFLGTGGSSLGGADFGAARRLWRAWTWSSARRAAPAFSRQSRPGDSRRSAGAVAARQHALHRHVEVRRHRRDPDANHGRTRGGTRRRSRDPHCGTFHRHFGASARAQAQRPARSSARSWRGGPRP